MQSLANSPALFISVAGLFGLMVGSFLNVVIHRIPIMQQRETDAWAKAIVNDTEPDLGEPYNLSVPASHCPSCESPVRPWQNIPILSWLALRGRCANCKTSISIRYPLVELVCGLLTMAVAWHFGYGLNAAGAIVLTWALLALTMIDVDTQTLPDVITLPWLWLGLLFSIFASISDPVSSIIGAAAGYLSLWLLFHAFRLATGKEGMGYGDFKLLALLGAWLGWQMLPIVILIASLSGALVGLTLMATGILHRGKPMPFGPALAVAGWVALMGGSALNNAYLSLFI